MEIETHQIFEKINKVQRSGIYPSLPTITVIFHAILTLEGLLHTGGLSDSLQSQDGVQSSDHRVQFELLIHLIGWNFELRQDSVWDFTCME